MLLPGQSWIIAMMRLILGAKELEEGKDVPLTGPSVRPIPFIETEKASGETAADVFTKLEQPRIMKSHLPYSHWKEQLDKYPNMRVLQTLRNPKDTLVSFFHHMSNDNTVGGFNGTWDQFFQLFKENKLPYGDFFEGTAAWLKFLQNRNNTLILRYEEMKKDHRGHVFKIAQFLGCDISDKVADSVVEKSSFQNMSKEINSALSESKTWKKGANFVREGKIGNWVSYFSVEQSKFVDSKYEEFLEPLGLTFEYGA